MAAFNKFEAVSEQLPHKKHDWSADTFRVALTNEDNPPLATDVFLTDLTEIDYTGLSSRDLTRVSSEQVGGVYKLVLQDLTLTNTAPIPPFRYVVWYNVTNSKLLGFWDVETNVEMSAINSEFLIEFTDNGEVINLS